VYPQGLAGRSSTTTALPWPGVERQAGIRLGVGNGGDSSRYWAFGQVAQLGNWSRLDPRLLTS